MVPFIPPSFMVYFLRNILLLSTYRYQNQEITINIVETVGRPHSILANGPIMFSVAKEN